MRVVMVANPAGVPSTAGTPNAFTANTKATTADDPSAGRRRGRVTVRRVATGPAPLTRAARSTSGSTRVASAPATISQTSGVAATVSTRTTPSGPYRPGRSDPTT